MKCQNCGSELDDGVLFCRDCGNKVGNRKKRFCRECGAELNDGVKFCGNCGAKTELPTPSEQNPKEAPRTTTKDKFNESPISSFADQADKIKGNVGAAFTKATESVPKSKNKSKLIIIAVSALALIAAIALIGTCSRSGSGASQNTVDYDPTPTNYTISKGAQYAFMSDEAHVYIATAVSDSIIKIERWGKSWLPEENMDHEADLGAFKINDRENGFSWVDDAHTAFNFTFSDKSTSSVRNPESHIFTVNVSNSDRFKGTDYDKSIACYTYRNDDWHMYRAIPLTESLIKIERWSRTDSFAWTSFCYSGDWLIIDTNKTDTDFEWSDGEKTAFTITTRDPENGYYWKQDTFVVFELETPDYKHTDVLSYLDSKN